MGSAIGDCAGREAEFIHDPALLNVTDLPAEALYTDDTQMAVCVAEALVSAGHLSVEAFMEVLSKNFVAWYHTQSDPRFARAPGESCLRGCANLAAGIHWEISGINSKGCGSAMRSPPIGLFHFKDMTKCVDFAKESSRPTHNNDIALCAAVGAAMMPALALQEVPVGIWGHEIASLTSGVSEPFVKIVNEAVRLAGARMDPRVAMTDDYLGEAWAGHSAVASALFCCVSHPGDFKQAILTAVNTVGDSDTIGAITGAAMGARLGLGAIPKDWVERVEDSAKLMELADRLYDAHLKAYPAGE